MTVSADKCCLAMVVISADVIIRPEAVTHDMLG